MRFRNIGKAGKSIKLNMESLAFPCLPCSAEDHILCRRPNLDNMTCCCSNLIDEQPQLVSPGGNKAAIDITDVQSTGRKRAALLFPIEEGMICEWSYLKFAGGGVVPIIGCMDNPATDRHHGPDKNTLNNKPENVHRICATDHNRWHQLNDQFYGQRPSGTEPFIPLDGYQWTIHDPNTKAGAEEVIKNEVDWDIKKSKRMIADALSFAESHKKVLDESR